jgi:RHS repeat-associated protein
MLGNLRSVTLPDGTLIEYVIDASNRRVGKKMNGTLVAGWIYSDHLRIVAETDGSGAVTKRFVYGSRRNIPDYMVWQGGTYRIIVDQLGSPRYVLQSTAGTLAESISYDEFGNVLSDTNPGFTPFGFAGGLYDRDTHLTRFGARDYDAGPGRWTAKDPALFSGRNSNLYAYAFDDPANFIDLNGLDAIINNSGKPVVVSGNPGEGHGSGDQVYGVVPSSPQVTYGGSGVTIGSFPTREEAERYAQYIEQHGGRDTSCPIHPNRTKAIRDVDFFYKGADAIKIRGDEQGPVTTIGPGPEVTSREDVVASVIRFLLRPFEDNRVADRE